MLTRTGPRRLAAACATSGAVAAAAAVLAGVAVPLLVAAPARADVVRSREAWVISELNLEQAWATTEGRGVTVAVIDSGVDPYVSDLAGSVTTGPDYTGVHTPSTSPYWGVHGTWMASLVAGHGHDGGGDGIIGSAPDSRVLSIRVITDTQDPNYAKYDAQSTTQGQQELASAIDYAVEHKAGVISMSLGYGMPSTQVRQALQNAYSHNVVVVASAGNSGSGDTKSGGGNGQAPYSFPADYPGVLAVGAVKSSGTVAGFSSKNVSVQVSAPGYNVPAQGRDDGYWYVSGTSPACALTAGVVALIKSKYPGLTDAQVISAITTSTTPGTRPKGGWDDQIGFGVVNAGDALAAARKITLTRTAAKGLSAPQHFGGGPQGVPAAPVAPRGPGALIGYLILAMACVALVALATARLLTPVGARAMRASSPGGAIYGNGGQVRYGGPGGPPPQRAPPPGWPGSPGVGHSPGPGHPHGRVPPARRVPPSGGVPPGGRVPPGGSAVPPGIPAVPADGRSVPETRRQGPSRGPWLPGGGPPARHASPHGHDNGEATARD